MSKAGPSPSSIVEPGLEPSRAIQLPQSPLSSLKRTAALFPSHTAVDHGSRVWIYVEFYARCRRLASALAGVAAGDTVSVFAPNVPALLEVHYGVGMAGAVLNALVNVITFALNASPRPGAAGFPHHQPVRFRRKLRAWHSGRVAGELVRSRSRTAGGVLIVRQGVNRVQVEDIKAADPASGEEAPSYGRPVPAPIP